MNTDALFRALGEIDDTFVETAAHPYPKSTLSLWKRRVIAMAACAAVVLGVGVGAYHHTNSARIVYPAENPACITDSFSAQQYGIPKKYTYAELAAKADLVICADVKASHIVPFSSDFSRHFEAYAEITVRDVLKGEAKVGDTVFVVENAIGYYNEQGRFCGHIHTSCGEPLMMRGNRVLLFLRQNRSERSVSEEIGTSYYVISPNSPTGKFFYDTDGLYHSALLYNTDPPGKQPIFTAYLVDDDPKSLEEIKALINE